MAKIKYTYCTKCGRTQVGIAKFCDKCGQSAYLTVKEKDDGKASNGLTAEENEIYNKLPAELRNLYLRVKTSNDISAKLEWYKLIQYSDPRIKFIRFDAVDSVGMYRNLYEEANCGEAAYMLGRCYRQGVMRTTPFTRSVEADAYLAEQWFAKAAEAGYYPAYVELGRLVEDNRTYHMSDKVSRDLNIAAHYYGCAKQHGLAEGSKNYARLVALGYKGILSQY